MIGLDKIVSVVQELIKEASSSEFDLNGEAVKKGLMKLFPETAKEVAKVIDLNASNIHVEKGEGFVKVLIDGFVDLPVLKTHYPAIDNLVEHLKKVKLQILDPKLFGEGFDNSDSNVPKLVNNSLKLWEYQLDNAGGTSAPFTVRYCLDKDGEGLLFMDADNNPLPGKRAEYNIDKESTFIVSLDSSYRIKELGCFSISLPLGKSTAVSP